MKLKTLKDIVKCPNCKCMDYSCVDFAALKQEVIKWIKEFNKFTSQYCENEGNLSDDEVMAKMKKQHPEWEKEIKIDFSDDDLCKFYFLEDWLKYFFNIKQGDLK